MGTTLRFGEAAEAFGGILAAEGIGLVYGGGGDGLMGRLARATLAAGGYVTGIIPSFLVRKEHALTTAQEMLVVENMHERKQAMFDRADAFVALPGGIGTLEELVEQMTWAQLERHAKPILIADINGFWRPLLALFAHMRGAGFIRSRLRASLPRGGEDRGRHPDAARGRPASGATRIPGKRICAEHVRRLRRIASTAGLRGSPKSAGIGATLAKLKVHSARRGGAFGNEVELEDGGGGRVVRAHRRQRSDTADRSGGESHSDCAYG